MIEKREGGDKGPIPAKKKRRRKKEKEKKKRMKASRVTPHLSPTPEKSQSPGRVLIASKIRMRRALHIGIKEKERRKW